MALEKLQITPNVPTLIALKFTEGKIVQGRFGDQVFFTLAQPADTCLYMDLGPAEKINALKPRRNEPFFICKRWTGKKADSPIWDAWPVGEGEAPPPPPPSPASIATGIPDTDIEQQLRASLARIEQAKQAEANVRASAPVKAATSGNGTTHPNNNSGNGAQPNGSNGAPKPYAAAGIPAPPPVKVPMDVAFRELLKVVIDGLKEAGEQWTDSAKQDAVSTLLIQAARDGYLTMWQRGGAK